MIFFCRGVGNIIVIGVVNGLGEPNSNSGWGGLHFTLCVCVLMPLEKA